MARDHTRAFTGARIAHETVGEGQPDPHKGANERLVREIWAVLQSHYPGQPWHVAASHGTGMAQIFLPSFTTWSFNIRLRDLAGDPGMRVVVKGAGELLERYRLPRAGFDVAHYIAAQKRFQPLFNMNRRPPD